MVKLMNLLSGSMLEGIFGHKGAKYRNLGTEGIERVFWLESLEGTYKELIEIFEDDELRRLTERNPVEKILGKTFDFWRESTLTAAPEYGFQFFSDSPARSVAAKLGILPRFLHYAAREDKWVGYKTNMTREDLTDLLDREGIEPSANGKVELYGGMVRPSVYQEGVFNNPTQGFISFVCKKIRRQ